MGSVSVRSQSSLCVFRPCSSGLPPLGHEAWAFLLSRVTVRSLGPQPPPTQSCVHQVLQIHSRHMACISKIFLRQAKEPAHGRPSREWIHNPTRRKQTTRRHHMIVSPLTCVQWSGHDTIARKVNTSRSFPLCSIVLSGLKVLAKYVDCGQG